jgi:drug/metabolite transporter (DMT)-like permease
MNHTHKTGYLLAFSAAILWGVSGTCGQYLFQHKEINAEWLVTVRLLISGIILLGISCFKKQKDLTGIWRNREDAKQLVLFGIFGMLAVQYTFFAAIKHSNAATATVLQYIAPALIACYYALKMKRLPQPFEVIAVVLALAGTFLLVTHGSIHSLSITKWALFWGLAAAVTLAYYSIQPIRLLNKYNAVVVIGWSMLIGGIALAFVHPPWKISGIWDSTTYLFAAIIILLGSIVAFYAYLTAVKLVGAKIASLLACAEPLSTAILAVIWLKVPFGISDWLGMSFILLTIFILALNDKRAIS